MGDRNHNNHARRMERLVAGALKSMIDAHGPVTAILIGSATKRIVGALAADGLTRVPIPVITKDFLKRLERVCDAFEELPEIADQIACDLAVLREDNHPDGWSDIEFVERDSGVPVAVVKHHVLRRAERTYTRKRDGKKVDLESGPEPLKPEVKRETVTCD